MGQGPNPQPNKLFDIHYILEFEERLFDPSYGTPSVGDNDLGGTGDRVKDWEDAALAFYGFKFIIGPVEDDNFIIYMRPNYIDAASPADVKLTPVPTAN